MNNFEFFSYKNTILKKVNKNGSQEYYDLEGNQVQLESFDELDNNLKTDDFVDNSTDTISFISEIIKNYIHLNNEAEYSILAAFVILSYSYELFNRIPYLWFNASKGTGKTTTLNCLSKVVRNPVFASAYTGSSLYRKIEVDSPTLLLDEAEDLDKRSTLKNAIINVLNSGYEKNGSVMLTKNNESVQYKTYSVKILAGINDLLDTIKDRSIKITLQKSNISFSKTNILENNQSTILKLLEDKINNKISELCEIIKNPGIISLSDKFINRAFDKWFPILSITKVFGNSDLFDYLNFYAEDEINKSLEEDKNCKENIVKSIIEEFYKENAEMHDMELNGKYYFKTKTLLDYFEDYQPYKIFKNQSEFTTYLKLFNIHTDRRRYNHKVTSFYTFLKANFQNLKLITSEKKAS